MSLLPCDSDLVALGLLVDGRYWDLDALRDHVSGLEVKAMDGEESASPEAKC